MVKSYDVKRLYLKLLRERGFAVSSLRTLNSLFRTLTLDVCAASIGEGRAEEISLLEAAE